MSNFNHKIIAPFQELKLWTPAHLTILKEFTRSRFRESDYNSILGSIWNLLNPFLMLLVLYCIFNARFGLTIKDYPIYILVGVICVGFFSSAVAQTIPILARGQELLLNTTVPAKCLFMAELIFLSSKFLIELFFCLILSFFFNLFAWKYFLYLVIVTGSFLAMVTGLSLILSLAYCIVRDISHIWNFFCKVLLFATPIFYSLRDISEWAKILVYWGNPVTPFILFFHSIFVSNGSINLFILLHCILLGLTSLAAGLILFNRYNRILIERT